MQDDTDLLQRARDRDEEALAEIYARFQPELRRYAMRLLGESGLAEECVAESFARFLAAMRADQGPREHLRAYLYRVAHNWAADYHGSQRTVELPDDHRDSAPHQEDQVADQLEREQVLSAMALLTEDQRDVLRLRFVEGREIRDVAATLGKDAAAVRALQHRALASLRRLLEA